MEVVASDGAQWWVGGTMTSFEAKGELELCPECTVVLDMFRNARPRGDY